jgi:hypothetical protein
MTCRCCCRMPADGSRKKDYRAGPCKMPRLAIPLAGSSTTSPATQGQSCTVYTVCTTVCTACTACTCQTHPPPQLSCRYAPPPLRPCAPTPPSTQSSTSSGGFDIPPASSQASLKRVFHASPGAAHVWARWKLPHSGPENSRELHGMLPRSTRDKAGARRTRHCSEWRGEGSGEQWMVRVKEERKMCHSTRARHQGQQRDHPQSPELQPCSGHKVLTKHQR